jgi:tetratricopeptide (TPR) repeat protein
MSIQPYSINNEHTVQDLIFDPNKKLRLNQTLLHIAAQEGNEAKVRSLIKTGATIDAFDDSKRTPLFLAVIQGHQEVVQLLIDNGASTFGQDINYETLLDIAIRYDHENIVHLLLGTTSRLDKTKIANSDDVEKFHENCLVAAKKEGLIEEQIYYLFLLSNSYLKKNNFVTSASILNTAVAILKKEKASSPIESYLFSRLERIELLLLESNGIMVSCPTSNTSKYRDFLRWLRSTCEGNFQKGEPSQKIANELTLGFKQLFKIILKDAMHRLGPPPVKWACVGMGSCARAEMCPYSDLEFVFIIEKETISSLRYFRIVSKLLQLMIINVGETKFQIFGKDEASPTPNGFCMDSGGNVPLGGVFELIGTPQKLSQLQSYAWINDNIILANVMSCVSLIDGDKDLLNLYNNEKLKQQYLIEKDSFVNHQVLALELLKGHLKDFAPDLSEEKEKLKAFGVKKELYRPIQETINCLCLYYQIQTNNTFDRIDQLVKRDVLSSKGADNLKKALNIALSLRLEAHFFYKDEIEFLCHPQEGKKSDQNLLYIDQRHQKNLENIYTILQPFHNAVEEFYQSLEKKSLNSQNFSSNGFYSSGAILEMFFSDNKRACEIAHTYYQKATAIRPDIDTLKKVGHMESLLRKYDPALQHYQEALELAKKQYGENHLIVANCYCNIGMIIAGKDDRFKEALVYYKKSLKIALANHTPKGQSDAGIYYLTIGSTLKHMGQPQKALVCAGRAAALFESLLNSENNNIAGSFTLVGNLYEDLGNLSQAVKYHQKSLEHCTNEDYASIGEAHYNLGSCFKRLKRTEEAIMHLKESLAFYSKIPSFSQLKIATSCDELGKIFKKIHQPQKALRCFQQSFKIKYALYGKKHPEVADALDKMGTSLYEMKIYPKAIKCFRNAIKILKIDNLDSTNLANYSIHLANSYFYLYKFDIYIKIYKKVIDMRIKEFGADHADMATTYSNLGLGLRQIGKKKEALAFFNKALSIYIKTHGSVHPDITLCRLYINTVS